MLFCFRFRVASDFTSSSKFEFHAPAQPPQNFADQCSGEWDASSANYGAAAACAHERAAAPLFTANPRLRSTRNQAFQALKRQVDKERGLKPKESEKNTVKGEATPDSAPGSHRDSSSLSIPPVVQSIPQRLPLDPWLIHQSFPPPTPPADPQEMINSHQSNALGSSLNEFISFSGRHVSHGYSGRFFSEPVLNLANDTLESTMYSSMEPFPLPYSGNLIGGEASHSLSNVFTVSPLDFFQFRSNSTPDQLPLSVLHEQQTNAILDYQPIYPFLPFTGSPSSS
ncbi:hypothetical protein BDR26DRAFT_922150 [Obelidium mucronatum]|nr:hypothetical protein BDR26DRAFT_922150 [Obelidium mucronatum]